MQNEKQKASPYLEVNTALRLHALVNRGAEGRWMPNIEPVRSVPIHASLRKYLRIKHATSFAASSILRTLRQTDIRVIPLSG